jgi:hypothetical protein
MELGSDIDRQLGRIPKPTVFPPPKPVNPLYYAQLLLGLIVLGSGVNLFAVTWALFGYKSDLVVVSMDGGEPIVWKTFRQYEVTTGKVRQYEVTTGKDWQEMPGTVRFADYEASTFEDRLSDAWSESCWICCVPLSLPDSQKGGKTD